MQTTSALFTDIIRGHYWCEVKANIDNVDYGPDMIVSMKTSQHMFDNYPQIGLAVCAELDMEMIKPDVQFSRMAKIMIYVRVTDGSRHSEWLPKGVYYIDTRKESTGNGVRTITLHCYDAMLKTVVDARAEGAPAWNNFTDLKAVKAICEKTGLELDKRTILDKALKVPDPGTGDEAYTCREVLAMIGAWYGGSWVMSCEGKLQLVILNSLPEDDKVLVSELGEPIEIGGEEIYAE